MSFLQSLQIFWSIYFPALAPTNWSFRSWKEKASTTASTKWTAIESMISKLAAKWSEVCSWVSTELEKRHPEIKFTRLPNGEFLPPPGHEGVGLWLRAAAPGAFICGERARVGFGYNVTIPDGYIGMLIPAKKLADWGVSLLDPFNLDAICLQHYGRSKFHWEHGQPLAKLVLLPIQKTRVSYA